MGDLHALDGRVIISRPLTIDDVDKKKSIIHSFISDTIVHQYPNLISSNGIAGLQLIHRDIGTSCNQDAFGNIAEDLLYSIIVQFQSFSNRYEAALNTFPDSKCSTILFAFLQEDIDERQKSMLINLNLQMEDMLLTGYCQPGRTTRLAFIWEFFCI